MQAQIEMDELDKWIFNKMQEIFEQMYRKKLSEAIKRGIEAKRLQKKL